MIGTYEGKFGRLVVDFDRHQVVEDNLDRKAIWEEAGQNYEAQAYLYSEICEALLGDHPEKLAPPRNDREYWAGRPRDFGYEVILADGYRLIIDAEGTSFQVED